METASVRKPGKQEDTWPESARDEKTQHDGKDLRCADHAVMMAYARQRSDYGSIGAVPTMRIAIRTLAPIMSPPVTTSTEIQTPSTVRRDGSARCDMSVILSRPDTRQRRSAAAGQLKS